MASLLVLILPMDLSNLFRQSLRERIKSVITHGLMRHFWGTLSSTKPTALVRLTFVFEAQDWEELLQFVTI